MNPKNDGKKNRRPAALCDTSTDKKVKANQKQSLTCYDKSRLGTQQTKMRQLKLKNFLLSPSATSQRADIDTKLNPVNPVRKGLGFAKDPVYATGQLPKCGGLSDNEMQEG